MKKIPLTTSRRLEELVWHINEAHTQAHKKAGSYFQLNTLTIKILMDNPNHVENTGCNGHVGPLALAHVVPALRGVAGLQGYSNSHR